MAKQKTAKKSVAPNKYVAAMLLATQTLGVGVTAVTSIFSLSLVVSAGLSVSYAYSACKDSGGACMNDMQSLAGEVGRALHNLQNVTYLVAALTAALLLVSYVLNKNTPKNRLVIGLPLLVLFSSVAFYAESIVARLWQ